MQPDVGGVWRHEVLRRMQEAQRAEAAARPIPPPGPRRRITVRWWAAAGWLRGRLRRGLPPVTQTELTSTHPETENEPGGLWEEVARSCEEALAARPDLVGLWVGLSLAAGRLGDLDLSEGAYEVARVLSPDEADAWRDAFRRDFPEIDLTETVNAEIVLPDGLATSGNGR